MKVVTEVIKVVTEVIKVVTEVLILEVVFVHLVSFELLNW